MTAVNIPGFRLLLFKVGIVADISICPETLRHPHTVTDIGVCQYQSGICLFI